MGTDTYALGDVHGDLESAVSTLLEHGVVDAAGRWAAGDATLVQLGDMLDGLVRTGVPFRAPDGLAGTVGGGDVAVLQFFAFLREQARAVGGDVLCVIGNHEVMTLVGMFQYAARSDIPGRLRAFSPGGDGHRLVTTMCRPLVFRNGVLYCHAGLTPSASAAMFGDPPSVGPTDIERVAGQYCDRVYSGGGAEGLAADPAVGLGPDSLTSTRAYMNPGDDGAACTSMLDRLGVDRMVIGHNVQERRVSVHYRGRVVLADVGLSRAFTATPSTTMLLTTGKGEMFELVSRGVRRPV